MARPSVQDFDEISGADSGLQGREMARRMVNPASPEPEKHQKGPGPSAAPRSWTATVGEHPDLSELSDDHWSRHSAELQLTDWFACNWKVVFVVCNIWRGFDSAPQKQSIKEERLCESAYADRGAHHSPTTGLRAIASAPGSDCGPGAARPPHAASDDAQPGQPFVPRRAEGLCALSSGSSPARFGVQPAARVSVLARSAFQGFPAHECGSDKVFYSSAPKSRALIATQLMIGGVESNPGWPTHDSGTPSSSRGRPLIQLPTLEEVQESARPKPPDTEHFFQEWKKNRDSRGEESTRSPAQPQELEQALVLGGSGERDSEQVSVECHEQLSS
ncbi:hypothetical protein KFL_002010020 [Klebsormidium nitens]|uniref:Uncharacterized protein n=1 Tax=Klebsormidium nitens TaxID=105231 RepID=A0A0U9HK04_KLENI|nr:hypothetical protein KFL_002010020 [Klebsormidium nitens]|eukprot:GAQ84686.1 hypothetical protein KFL_002010020 [Klebsormidium nitens]